MPINKQIIKNMCPPKSYWWEGLATDDESFLELLDFVAYEFENIDDLFQKCEDGTLSNQHINQFKDACERSGECGVEFSFISISKEDMLASLLEQTRKELVLYMSKRDDMKNNDEIEKQIKVLLESYNYMKIGKYYFYRLAVDDVYMNN